MDVLKSLCACDEADDGEVVVEHPDCDACAHNIGDSCRCYKQCIEWREWFSYEWNKIRENARRMGGRNGKKRH